MLISKWIKKLIIIILIVLFISNTTYAVVSETKQFDLNDYANDYANVLSEGTKEYIKNANIELQKKTKAQIVVVTVNSLNGQTIESYATELYRKFGIGDKNLNNGVLLLCSTGERKLRIEVRLWLRRGFDRW